jgi:hypothetical protein
VHHAGDGADGCHALVEVLVDAEVVQRVLAQGCVGVHLNGRVFKGLEEGAADVEGRCGESPERFIRCFVDSLLAGRECTRWSG